MRFLFFLLWVLLGAEAAAAQGFSFVAYGDVGYQLPRDTARVERLIDAINRERPAFTIHVGDFKGYTSCSDQAYREHLAMFRRHDHPLLLTLGDNDWTDCGVDTAGSFDPLERLAVLRRLMFDGRRSLGARPMQVVSQSAAFPENQLWIRAGIVFANVHVVGPSNGLVMDKARAAEAIDRTAAGAAWIRNAFRAARERKSPGLVLAFHIDPWSPGTPNYEDGPVAWLTALIGEEAAAFPGQVLVVHGDSHRLVIDTPYRRADIDRGTTRGANVTRLMVPGWPDHRAVRVDVDPSRPELFGFRVVMAPEESRGALP